MRARIVLRRAAAIAVMAGLAAGCSAEFKLPTESPGRVIPPDGSYQLLSEWEGLTGIRDVELTNGEQLFLLFQNGGTGASPRGSVSEYQLVRNEPLGPPLTGLFNPVALSGNTTRVFVLDQGDTCMARTNPATGTCDATNGWDNRITDIDKYWKVVEYDVSGGAPRSTFTDTTLSYVYGVAVDAQNNVYVSGVAIIILINQDDSRLRYRVNQFRIYKYSRGLRADGLADINVLPTGAWHRDTTFLVEEGSGIGTVVDARGLAWRKTLSNGLYVADFGKNWAQRIHDQGINAGDFRIDGVTSGEPLSGPTDVSADDLGFVYVLDGDHQRVLRFAPNLGPDEIFIQRVDVEGNPVVNATGITVDDSLVYVADRGTSRVLRFKRRP